MICALIAVMEPSHNQLCLNCAFIFSRLVLIQASTSQRQFVNCQVVISYIGKC